MDERKAIITITCTNDCNADGTGHCETVTSIEFEPPFVGDEYEESLVASLVGEMLDVVMGKSDRVEGPPELVN